MHSSSTFKIIWCGRTQTRSMSFRCAPMSDGARRLGPRLVLAVLIGWAWTIHGQVPSAALSGRDDNQVIKSDWQGQIAGREEHTSSRELAKHVRSAIARDKSFSGYAHKVRVIPSVHRTVTLKGRVRSEEERHAVEAKAAEITGVGNVNTELFTEIDRSK